MKLQLVFLIIFAFLGMFLVVSTTHELIHLYQYHGQSEQMCFVGFNNFIDTPFYNWVGGWITLSKNVENPRYLLPTENTEFEAYLITFILAFGLSYLIFKYFGQIEDKING